MTTGLQSLVTYAHITEFECGDDRSTVNDDALGARLFDLGQPGGAIHHSTRFGPLLAEGPADPSHTNRPDREYGYELHASFQ